MKLNRLGWITSLKLETVQNYIDEATYLSASRLLVPTKQEINFTLEGSAVITPGVVNTLESWMQEGIYMPTYTREFMCLFCSSPNRLTETHCTRCGAPRSFILG